MTFKIEPISYTLSLTALASLLIGAVWMLVKHYAKKQIEEQFNKKFEGYKNELQIVLESKKFDFQRMTHDFSLYRNKKHECYPELFKLSLVAIQSLSGVINDWHWPRFNNFSAETLRNYLQSKNVDGERIIDFTNSAGNLSEETVIYEIKMAEWREVKGKFVKANEYFLSSEIYISAEVSNCTRIIFNEADMIIKSLVWDILGKSYGNEEELSSTRPDINTLEVYQSIILKGQDLKTLIKKELSIADYESI